MRLGTSQPRMFHSIKSEFIDGIQYLKDGVGSSVQIQNDGVHTKLDLYRIKVKNSSYAKYLPKYHQLPHSILKNYDCFQISVWIDHIIYSVLLTYKLDRWLHLNYYFIIRILPRSNSPATELWNDYCCHQELHQRAGSPVLLRREVLGLGQLHSNQVLVLRICSSVAWVKYTDIKDAPTHLIHQCMFLTEYAIWEEAT